MNRLRAAMAGIVAIVLMPLPTAAQQPRDAPVIVMSGEGVVQAALDRAWADAAAGAAGRTVERVIRIEEHIVASRPPMPYVAAAREALQASDAPPIAAGQIELRTQVTLTAELK